MLHCDLVADAAAVNISPFQLPVLGTGWKQAVCVAKPVQRPTTAVLSLVSGYFVKAVEDCATVGSMTPEDTPHILTFFLNPYS